MVESANTDNEAEERLDDLEAKIENIEKLVKQSHGMLQIMRRYQNIALIGRILYYFMLLGLALGAYYFIQPYLLSLLDTYAAIQDGISKVTEVGHKIPAIPDISSFFGGSAE